MATILIIDDEQVILDYLEMVLTKLGYDVITACDSVSGCNDAKNPRVKLIISDLNMPGEMSGISLIRELRALRPDCPVIVLTGYPTDSLLKEAEELNVEFLTKPFEIPFLNSILKRFLPLEPKSNPNPVDKNKVGL